MATVRVIQTAFVGTANGMVSIHTGTEYDVNHPLVKGHPELFTPVPEPEERRVLPQRKPRPA